jgi:DNA-binding NtrC family response regulator
VVILGLSKPFDTCLSVLNKIKAIAPHVEVIFVSLFDDESLWLWIEVIQRGAYEFLPKPLDALELQRVLIQATQKHHPVTELKMPPAESITNHSNKVPKSRASSSNY